jgi:lysophospholipase L1-like esterase
MGAHYQRDIRMRIKTAVVGGVCAACALAPASAVAKTHGTGRTVKPSYYVALGDSLAQGVQPDAAGNSVETKQGYADFLYAAKKHTIKGLRLEDLGCPGETTQTMLKGGICKYVPGNQLTAAVRFIKTHKIAFITLDIGANNVDSCANNGSINGTCLTQGIAQIGTDVPTILAKLRRAAGAKTKIAAMTYYDPFLADYLTPSTQPIAAASVPLAKNVNATLVKAFKAKNVRVADVAAAFDTYVPFTTTATLAGHGTVPLAVAKICTLTWICAAAPRGPNIHANVAGYHAIEKVFAAKL